MLSFSRKADYALVAMAELAREPGVCLSSTRVAEATEAPEALLRNVLKDLAKAGLLRAERGPFGGYALATNADAISVLAVVEAVDGPIALARCCKPGESPEEHGCTHSPRCRVQHAMRLMHDGVLDVLRRVTVAALSEEPSPGEAASGVPLTVGSAAPADGGRGVDEAVRGASDVAGVSNGTVGVMNGSAGTRMTKHGGA